MTIIQEKHQEKEGGGTGTYTGETSRSMFKPVCKRYCGVESLEKDSCIVKHWFTTHPARGWATLLHGQEHGQVQGLLDKATEGGNDIDQHT